jgi:menaquinone-dependent protoporphyrinogen oxidase
MIMTGKVLVAFATSYGSTQEVAEAAAQVLRDAGLEVEVQAARKVRTLEGFQAVVLGAPLYMFRWHNDARRFLAQQRKALTGVPLAIFALGPFHNNEEELKSARGQLDKELAKFPWLAPAAVEVFPGKFDPHKLRFPFNLLPAMKNIPASDERDWEAIRSWVGSVVLKIQSAA